MNIERPLFRLGLVSGVVIGTAFLAACQGGGSGAPANSGAAPPPTSSPPPPPPPPPPMSNTRGGYFFGSVAGNYAEAIVTEDGSARLYIQGPPRDSSESFEPIQFVGTLTLNEDGSAVGEGALVGERCRRATDGYFCDGGIPAELNLTRLSGVRLEGELSHSAVAGPAVSTVSMEWPTSTYLSHEATLDNVEGVYWEALADFAHDGDVISTVDGAGRWFFQSAHTGCTGNGALTPHADGRFNVYQVELLIENCDRDYAYLNRSFTGLATRSIGDWWYWGNWLVFFLSSLDGEPNPVALTMWGGRQ